MENNDDICLNSSISSWIIDYYFQNIQFNQRYIIQINDMLMICQILKSTLKFNEFFSLCQNKLKQIKNKHDVFLEKYNQYLKEYNLIDIIDIFHQCQLNLFNKTIILTNKNIHNQIDQLFVEYLIELSSIDSKQLILTNEYILKKQISTTKQINYKNYLKHTLCMYLSLLIDTQNEYVLKHCLVASSYLDMEKNSIIYEILLSYLRNDNKLVDISKKSSNDIEKFIEELRIIIEENEHLKIESNITFRKLLVLIFQQLQNINQYDLIIQDIIEEFCQYFQTILIESALSEAKLINDRFFQSIAYLCAKQTIDLSIFNESSYRLQSKLKTIKKCRSCDLSTIHETNFEIDKSIIKRQPLREIDINTFNNDERNIETKKSSKNFIEFMLVSDNDKENLSIIKKKRSILSTKNDLPNKKHKKIDNKHLEIEQTND